MIPLSKPPVGLFRKDTPKEYILTWQTGQNKQQDYIYIGNRQTGYFFKFHKKEERNIHVMLSVPAKDKWGEIHVRSISVPLSIPPSDNDLKQILEMILKPKGWALIHLNVNSRKELVGIVAKHMIVKRLTQ